VIGGSLLLAAVLWTCIVLHWHSERDELGQQIEITRIATRLQEALGDSHRRAANVTMMLAQLQSGEVRAPGRAALEAGLRNALVGPTADFDGLQLIDAGGRRVLSVGQPVEVPEPMLRTALLPGLFWHRDRLLLAGNLSEGTADRSLYVATLRSDTLSDALRGEPGFVALRLADGALVAVLGDTVRLLQRDAPLPEADAATPSPAGPPLHRRMTPLPFGGAQLMLDARDQDGLRQDVLVSGAALAGLQLVVTLLLLGWLDRRLQQIEAHHARETDQARDRALRSIKDMLGALPATLYRAEIFPDRSLSFTSVSENVERMTGLTWADIARPDAWRERVHPADLPALTHHLDALYRDGESTAEYRFRHGDGHTVWLREQARIVAVGQHGGADIMGYLADVSGERMLQAQALASAKLATLGRMSAALAHELTQPISVMMLAAENGLDAHETMGAGAVHVMAAKLGRILEQTRRAQGLVEHLRMFGRSDEGQSEAVDLASAVDGALLLCSSVLERGGVAVEVLVPHGLPPVAANPVMLEQVIVNLLLNARDAMQRVPDSQRRVTLRAQALEDDRVELQVADSGRGLPPEAMARLFEPFFTTKGPGQGMGLGLSICHGIIRSFGGEITGENAAQGAVFTIRLPAAGLPGALQPGAVAQVLKGNTHAS
jgi:C4-dicarboxylate-specific signal transduction histidine kinase